MAQLTQEQIDALPDTLELKLRKPIELGSMTYSVLTFQEPTSGQIEEAFSKGDLVGINTLLALSAGVVKAVIDKLPAREHKRAVAFIESFSQDALPTGDRA